MTTPVAVFFYNRPEHSSRLLASLAACSRLEECSVTIFCDAPRNVGDEPAVESVRRIADSWAASHNATVEVAPRNLGLAASIISGTSRLCSKYGRVIVLEDDLVLNAGFLDYMLTALSRYEDRDDVYQISGFMFPVDIQSRNDAFFARLTTTWGWATWQRAWSQFPPSAAACERLLVERSSDFNLRNSYPYSELLRQRLSGLNESWGILWWATVCLANGIALHPRESLVWNGGFDSSGMHCRDPMGLVPELDAVVSARRRDFKLPTEVAVDIAAEDSIRLFLRQQTSSRSRLRAVVRFIGRLLHVSG